MTREPSSQQPASLDQARRERDSAVERRTAATSGRDEAAFVAASDVIAVLNRIGECVRALPSFGRTRTQTAAVVAKRTLSAISTCSPAGLPEGDQLRGVLGRLDATRAALRSATASGAERIAAARWLGEGAELQAIAAGEPCLEPRRPAHAYLLADGHVLRQPRDPAIAGAAGDAHESFEDVIDDLARAGALIAAEIDRLQQRQQRRYA